MGTTNAQTCETMGEQRNGNGAGTGARESQSRRSTDKSKKYSSSQEAEDRLKLARPLSPAGPEGSCSAVEAFYSDAVVLVTGATGFLGKALLEKLLRSCAGLGTIFVLMRPKRGCGIEQRFAELLENPVFERLRRECPSALSKLVPVKGDVGLPELGLSIEDRAMLMQRVNIVFHSAATVRFDEPIKAAVNLNTRGTDRIVDLCKGMLNLVCLVHVSTAYSNADLRDIQEMVYSTKVKPQTVIDMCENLDDETMTILEKKLMGKHPNTYTLTKGLAEQVVLGKSAGLPAVAIVRPSIVCAAFQEPFPGWVDNVCGITGILMEIGRGTVRSIFCQPQCIVDVVPVDYVVDTLICAAWHVSTSRGSQRYNGGGGGGSGPTVAGNNGNTSEPCSFRVYNCTSGSFNPIKWGEIGGLTRKYAIESPTKYVMWYPHVTYRSSQFLHKIAVAVLHFLPAFVIDLILRCRGSKPQMVKITKRTLRATKSGEFFANNEWYFHAENMKELSKSIRSSVVDGSTSRFNVDISNLDWETYVNQYVLGIRKYVLKDSPDTLDKARSKLLKLYWIRRVTQLFSLYILIKIITRASAR